MTFAIFHCISVIMNYVTEDLLHNLEDYLLKNYIAPGTERKILFQESYVCCDIDLDAYLKEKCKTFQDKLFEMIKANNLDEVEIYKKGNISRQLFSKIKSEKDYHPTKNTVFSLAIGMELSIDETSVLLEKAGYAFSSAIKSDLIVKYFIEHRIYNIFAINEALDKYGFKTL